MHTAATTRHHAPTGRASVWVLMLLLLIAVGAAVWAALPATAGQQVRRHLLTKLRAHYSDFHVDIGSARYQPGMGIIIEQIVLCDAARQSQSTSVVRVARMVVETDLSLQRLADFDFCPRRIVLHGLELETEIGADGRPTIERYFPLPEFGPGAELIEIESGSISIVDSQATASPRGPGRPLVLRQLRAKINNRPRNPQDPKQYHVTAEGDFFERLELVGLLGAEKWSIKSQVHRAAFDDSLAARLPFAVRQQLTKVAGLSTVFNGVLSVEGNLRTGISNWVSKVDVVDGRFDSGYLPYRMERLQGELLLRPGGIECLSLTSRIGDSRCQASGKTHGWGWPMPLEFSFATDELMLHDQLASCTPQACQDIFQSLLPRGRIAAKADVRFDGHDWTWQSVIDCLGVDIRPDLFPYPVKDVRGTITNSHQSTDSKGLVGTLGGQPIVCDLHLEKPNPKQNNVTSVVELSTKGPLAIDEMLKKALTPRGEATSKLETFVRSLNASGKVTLAGSRFERRADGTRSRTLDLRFEEGNLRYDRFPYPVFDIHGQIFVEDDAVHVVNIRGQSNDSATINAHGICQTKADGLRLQLEIDGYGISMDQSLRRALSADHQSMWDSLGPSGVLEHMNVMIDLHPGAGEPELKITAEQHERAGHMPRFVSITPESLPYRLDITRGHAQFAGDRVVISGLEGSHGQSRLHAQGQCVRQKNGRWVLSVEAQPPTRVLVDSDLLVALPKEVQETFRSMQLFGPPVSLRGAANFALPDNAHPGLDFDWNLLLQLEGNRIGDSGPIHDIRGEVQIAGQRINQSTNAAGRVHFDSLHVADVQVVNLQGPILIRKDQLFMGQAVNDGQSEQTVAIAESVRGDVFGGLGELDGHMDLSNGRFDVNARIDDVVFATMLRDMSQPAQQTTGKGRGVVRLRGLLGNYQTLSGQGHASLEDASLYQLPVIVRLLNILSVKPSHDGSLSDCELKFRVDGEQIHVDDVRIWGDILVLRGEGTANLRQELDFRFETGVSPNNLWSRLINPLKDRQFTLWTIDVTGTLASPIFDKRAMKQIEQALERLLPDLERTNSTRRAVETPLR